MLRKSKVVLMANFLCLARVACLLLVVLAVVVVVMFFVSLVVVMWFLFLTSESMRVVVSFARWDCGAALEVCRTSKTSLSESSASDRD